MSSFSAFVWNVLESLQCCYIVSAAERGQKRCEWEGESLKYTEEEFDTSVWPQLRQSGVVFAASSALKPPPHVWRHVTRFLFSRKRTSVVCFYHFLPQPPEQVGSCWTPVAGGRKGNNMYDRKQNPVSMEISAILLWELEQQSALCLGSSCNRLSERSLW